MQKTEQEHKRTRQFEKICNKVGKAIHEFRLIEDGDRVLVGLSGGKDSMILLEALANRKKHLPFVFDLFAIHVSATNIGYLTDTGYLSEFCASLDVPLYLEDIKVDLGIDPDKSPCFICSWHRRKAIFNKSRELSCNKVALGHHKDDAIQTFLMNLIYHGSVSSLPYTLKMFGGRIHLIRPLLMIPENELIYYAGMRNFNKHEKTCIYDNSTKREAIRNLIRELDKLNRNARKNLFKAMDNIYPDYLPRSRGAGSDR